MTGPSLDRITAAAGRCRRPEDLLAPAARAVIARACRSFLLATRITPTELLYDPARQIAFLNTGASYMDAVQKIGRIHARANPQASVHAHIAELYDICDAHIRNTAARYGHDLPPAADPFSFLDFVAAGADRAQIDLALTRALAACGSWAEKADTLLSLLLPGLDGPGLEAVDAVLAELLDLGFSQILGPFDRLDEAMHAILDLLTATKTIEDLSGRTSTLARMLASHGLPVTRATLKGQLERVLEGHAPYVSTLRVDAEVFAHIRVCARLAEHVHVVGRPMLTAAEKRLERWLSPDVLQVALGGFGNPLEKFRRALVLHRHVTGSGRAPIQCYIEQLFEEEKIVHRMQRQKLPPIQLLRSIADLCRLIDASGLAAAQAGRYVDLLSQAQTAIMRDKRLFEHLDQAAPDLAERTQRLLQMCQAGVFAPGPGRDMARRRLSRYVHHPEFRGAYLKGAPPDASTERLAVLSVELRKVGVSARLR